MGEWRTLMQSFSALDDSAPPRLTGLMVGESVYMLETSDTHRVRFRRESDSEQEFYPPKRSFDKVTAANPKT